MKALSVKQPYASQIAYGFKIAEYRSWSIKYRGPLCIVASKSDDFEGELPRGVTVCIVDVVDCEESAENGGYVWFLANPRHVQQVPTKGFAAIYNIEEPRQAVAAKGGVPPRCTYEVEVDGEEPRRFNDYGLAEAFAEKACKPGLDAMLSEVDDADGFIQPLHEYEY